MLVKMRKAQPAIPEACAQLCMFAPCLRQPVELCMSFIQPSKPNVCRASAAIARKVSHLVIHRTPCWAKLSKSRNEPFESGHCSILFKTSCFWR